MSVFTHQILALSLRKVMHAKTGFGAVLSTVKLRFPVLFSQAVSHLFTKVYTASILSYWKGYQNCIGSGLEEVSQKYFLLEKNSANKLG